MDESKRPSYNQFLCQLLVDQTSNLKTQFPEDIKLELNIEILEDYFQYCFFEGKWIKWVDVLYFPILDVTTIKDSSINGIS